MAVDGGVGDEAAHRAEPHTVRASRDSICPSPRAKVQWTPTRPTDARALDVVEAVVDEQHRRRVGADPRDGAGRSSVGSGFSDAEVVGVAGDVEEVVVAEVGAHVGRPVPLLVGAEVHAVAGGAQPVHQLDRATAPARSRCHTAAVQLLDRHVDAVRRQVVRSGWSKKSLSPRSARQLLGATTPCMNSSARSPSYGSYAVEPAAGQVLQHPVGVEQDVPDPRPAHGRRGARTQPTTRSAISGRHTMRSGR